MEKIGVAIIGFLSLDMGMGLNIQYAPVACGCVFLTNMTMKYYILICVLSLHSCQNRKVNSDVCDVMSPTDAVPVKEICIQLADNASRELEQSFDLQSCVRFSDQTLIGDITRTLVCKEHTEMHSSLLYSVDGRQINDRIFQHDEIAEYRFGDGHPFYYSKEQLFYIRNFDNIVYELSAEKINSVFDIQLSNQLLLEFVKSNPNSMSIIKINYL